MIANFDDLRTKMVDGQLRTTDVTKLPVLDAFLAVPRERFVPPAKRALAYIDEDLDVTLPGASPRRYLTEPSPLAKLIQLAAPGPGDVVLDIGGTTGYSAAILSRIAGSVIALEADPAYAEAGAAAAVELGYDNIAFVTGPLEEGYPGEAPYDVILLCGAVETAPPALFEQLRDGGRLVAVEGYGNTGVARLHVKQNGVVSSRRAFNAAIKPLPGFRKEKTFVF